MHIVRIQNISFINQNYKISGSGQNPEMTTEQSPGQDMPIRKSSYEHQWLHIAGSSRENQTALSQQRSPRPVCGAPICIHNKSSKTSNSSVLILIIPSANTIQNTHLFASLHYWIPRQSNQFGHFYFDSVHQ